MIRVGIAGRLVDTISVGQRHPVQIGARTVAGRVKAVLPMRGAGTRTVDVILTLDASELGGRSGDLATLTLREKIPQAGYWLPTGTLAEGARGLWSVYVLEPVSARRLPGDSSSASHRVVPYLVETLHQESDRVFVRGALPAGAQVVADGVHRVVPGQLVRVPPSRDVRVAERESRHVRR